jgi:hypothetical protein
MHKISLERMNLGTAGAWLECVDDFLAFKKNYKKEVIIKFLSWELLGQILKAERILTLENTIFFHCKSYTLH